MSMPFSLSYDNHNNFCVFEKKRGFEILLLSCDTLPETQWRKKNNKK